MMNEQRPRSTEEENPSLSPVVLPDELIEAILVRLPVSSLLRFKSVSKSWLSVISNPQFAKSHIDLAASPTHRLLLNCTEELQFQSLDIESSPPNDESVVLNYYPTEQPYSHGITIFSRSITSLEVLGSCRGFLLLLLPNLPADGDFVVCNPSTGMQRLIPSSTSFSYAARSQYGIGYDESTDDYLLVSVRSNAPASTIEVFSLKTNLPLPLTLDDEYYFLDFGSRSDSFLHGSLHWLAVPMRSASVTNLPVVLAFDLIGRSLSEIPLSPDLALELKTEPYSLKEMRGCLCLYYSGYGGMTGTGIWIMKEYKVQSSWTKIVLSDIPRTYRFFPIYFTKCGDVFESNMNGRLLKLNDKGKLLAVWPKETKYRLLYSCMYTASLLMYTASLLSLPS